MKKKQLKVKTCLFSGQIFLFFTLIAEENISIRQWTVYFAIDDDNGVETILLTEE